MPLESIGVNSNPFPYLQARFHFKDGLKIFRTHSHRSHWRPDGTPTVVVVDLPETKQLESQVIGAGRYVDRLCSLVQPWRELIDERNRDRINSATSRFGSRNYSKPEFAIELSPFEKLVEKICREIQIKEEEYQVKLKKEKVEADPTKKNEPLEINVNTDPKLQRRLIEEAKEHRAEREHRKLEANAEHIALQMVLEHGDPGYIISILGADGMGIKHFNTSVRMGALYLLRGFAEIALSKLSNDISNPGLVLGNSLQRKQKQLELLAETTSLLSGIFSLVGRSKDYGSNDLNPRIRDYASTLKNELGGESDFEGVLFKLHVQKIGLETQIKEEEECLREQGMLSNIIFPN